MTAEEFLKRGTQVEEERTPAVVVTLAVTSANWRAVHVYRSCEWTMVIGMGGLAQIGVSSRELFYAMRIHRVPRRLWKDTEDRVRVIVNAARPLRNPKRERPPSK